MYKAYLPASSMRYSGLALSEVSPYLISHDSISRWFNDKCFRSRDLWEIAHKHVNSSQPSLLICDETALAKTRSPKMELVNYQYSGNAHDVIAGIGLINLLWHGLESESSVLIDYRIYDKDTDGKTKNTHFCDMLSRAKSKGVNPTAVVMDAWYSSLDNLKAIRSHGWIWVTTLRKNRVVNRDKRLENLDIPEEGLSVHLRGYGWIFVFKFEAKNGRIDYVATNRKIQRVSKSSVSRMLVGQLKSIIVKSNKPVVLSVVSLAPNERKEIISSWQLLLGLNSKSYK